MFKEEREMVIALISLLENNKFYLNDINDFIYLQEVEGLIGRPDFMLKSKKSKKIITIEMKLKNWKRALIQAYKYKSFSDVSYVCVDEKNIDTILKHLEEFKKYNIGLISISHEKKINIYNMPNQEEGYEPYLYSKAQSIFA